MFGRSTACRLKSVVPFPDTMPEAGFSADIDNQQTDNYGYNGNFQEVRQRDVASVVNDIRSVPSLVWKTSAAVVSNLSARGGF